jgi:hypothetical protein
MWYHSHSQFPFRPPRLHRTPKHREPADERGAVLLIVNPAVRDVVELGLSGCQRGSDIANWSELGSSLFLGHRTTMPDGFQIELLRLTVDAIRLPPYHTAYRCLLCEMTLTWTPDD